MPKFITENISSIALIVVGAFTGNYYLVAAGFISLTLTEFFGPDAPERSPERGVTQILRASDEPHKIIWGERPVSGVLSFVELKGDSNEFLFIVIALAGHQCQEISTVFLNDVGVDDSELDVLGDAVAPSQFANHLKIHKHLGADDQVADTDIFSTPLPAKMVPFAAAVILANCLPAVARFKDKVREVSIKNIQA